TMNSGGVWSKSSIEPRCLCHLPDHVDCANKNDEVFKEYRRLDIEDVTDSVMKVMRICGLKPWEVKRSVDVIRRSFQYFEEVRERIDRVPRKRFGKESFMHGLAQEAKMNRMDAQMAYAIVKRAFRALYYGTGEDGKRFICQQDYLTHTQECLWLHAAHRTAQIHAVLAGMSISEQEQFEERIECVYKNLYDVLQTRVVFADEVVCNCAKPPEEKFSKQVSVVGSVYTAEVEVLYEKLDMPVSSLPSKSSMKPDSTVRTANQSSASSKHNYGLKKARPPLSPATSRTLSLNSNRATVPEKCNCPGLRCFREEGEAREMPDITAECSQGPYICRWLPYTEEDDKFPEHCHPFPPMEVLCPPCEDEVSCDSECTCTCKVCTCQPEYDGHDFDGGLEEEGEILSKSGVEDHDTDFCWLAPLRGSSKERMDKQREKEKAKEMLQQPVEEKKEPVKKIGPCICRCKPKEFIYVAPFKGNKEEAKVEEHEVEAVAARGPYIRSWRSEDLLLKPPPRGVSPAGYRCWVRSSPPTPSESSEEQMPPLVMIMSLEAKSKGPEVVWTTKQQHQPSDGKSNADTAGPKTPPALPNKPKAPTMPSKPPLVPKKPEEKTAPEDTLTKEDIMKIIGFGFK
ncbi:hypothetical protein KR018_006827, partial [Drosophila ironensis]